MIATTRLHLSAALGCLGQPLPRTHGELLAERDTVDGALSRLAQRPFPEKTRTRLELSLIERRSALDAAIRAATPVRR